MLSHVAFFLIDLAFEEWAYVSSVFTGVIFLVSTDLELEMLRRSVSSVTLAIEKVSLGVLLYLGA
jgi:hypothetical protein